MAYKDYCFNCCHTREDHAARPGDRKTFEGGDWCRPCNPGVKTLAELMATADSKCPHFTESQMCGVCGSRMAWVGSPEGYRHADPAEDDHIPEPRRRRRRVQRV